MADAEKALRKLLNEKFEKLKEEDVTIKAISSGGANYTSDLYIVDIKHQGENLHLFAKFAVIGDKMRASMNADWLYKTEEIVYTQLMKTFYDLQEKHAVPVEYRFVFPKFYGCNTDSGEETVILENLNVRGFKTYDRLKSLNWEHAADAVSVLARFHALSFAYEKDYPEEFKIIAEKMKSQVGDTDQLANDGWMKFIGEAIQLLKDEYRDKMANFLGHVYKFEDYMKFRTPMSRTVLAHGDYRPSNMLFRRHNGVVETMVVDFQTLHAGCPVADLLYLIFLGTDEQFRRYYYKQLLEHYYQELSLASSRLKVDISEVYPRETFDSELKEMLPHALFMSVALLSVVTVDAEKAPELKGDDTSWDGIIVNQNALFTERFNGIVSDCARWGVI